MTTITQEAREAASAMLIEAGYSITTADQILHGRYDSHWSVRHFARFQVKVELDERRRCRAEPR